MTPIAPLTVEVKGGNLDERHLLTAVVGKSLRYAGFSNIGIKNEFGVDAPPGPLQRTSIFDMVEAIAPTLFKAEINVIAVPSKPDRVMGYETRWYNENDEVEGAFDKLKSDALFRFEKSGRDVANITQLLAGDTEVLYQTDSRKHVAKDANIDTLRQTFMTDTRTAFQKVIDRLGLPVTSEE